MKNINDMMYGSVEQGLFRSPVDPFKDTDNLFDNPFHFYNDDSDESLEVYDSDVKE